ncbi:glycosyl hydrolase [Mucidula mucida]|nr:glycosyl hydrolase [Mucidula mucida]
MKSIFAVVVALVALQDFASALINPIIPGWNPDPTFIRVGPNYFIATSTFETWPGVPIYHSTDLVNWDLIGHGLNRPSQLALFGTPFAGGVWAPALRYHDGVYYLTTTARYVYTSEFRLFPRSFYVTTTDIFSNEWSDPIYFDFLGYDSDLFWDTNGDVYCTWAGINNAADKIYGIYQSKVDLATGDSLTPAQLIFNGTLPNNSTARPEGPHVYLINGTYYLMIAEGETLKWHGRSSSNDIQRGPSPSGPWENNPNNPILFNGANLSLPVQDTGHSDLVELEDGTWWGSALAVRPQEGNFSHQQLVLTIVLLYAHSVQTFHSLTARPGYLRIKGNAYAPGDRDSPACSCGNKRFRPTSNLTEAGVSVLVGDNMHNDIAVTGDFAGSGKRYIVGPWALTTTNNTITEVSYAELGTEDEPVTLTIIGNSTEYTLGYAEGNSPSLPSSRSIANFFFTGASFAIYNTGTGMPTLAPADFKYWKQD